MSDKPKKIEKVNTGGKKITIGLDVAKLELALPPHMHGSLQPGFLQLEVDPTNVKRLSVTRDAESGKITIHLE